MTIILITAYITSVLELQIPPQDEPNPVITNSSHAEDSTVNHSYQMVFSLLSDIITPPYPSICASYTHEEVMAAS